MAEREMKMPEKKISKDTEEQNGIMPSQRQRPESGRYLLQIDRQPKSSFKHLTTLTRWELRKAIRRFKWQSMTVSITCTHW
jgi:hypothetical protein